MSDATEQNFNDYKQAEKKALELLAAMKTVAAKPVDIELALLVAIYELHKNSLPPATIAGIIRGHLNEITPHYAARAAAQSTTSNN